MAATTAPKLENPNNSSDLNSKPPADEDALSKQTPASSGGGGDESKGESASAITSDTHDSGAVTDIQKKAKRAERFGMPVQMTEKEKRNSRAERFGTASANGSDTCKASEELKKKTRAERFGIVQSDSSDDEAKKKARLARFGSTPKTDSVEEDKKKARAIRFSQPDSGSKTNGKENVEVKADIAAKAGGGT
ncbi:protein modifier of snc1 11 [Phtheirospermum japonicum]|uniref:Protein modifier of snc1 11 n=1 Tax=Phtheirospermum japonicum TaxID=374723 RepID=A0A830D0Z9_9LAMI|nr:protein modifier of snc1 11 [Phtheirospermum japonicum]